MLGAAAERMERGPGGEIALTPAPAPRAQHHRAGGDDAAAGVPFREEARAEDDAEQDADYARGGDVADRRDEKCGQDQDVGERAEDGDDERPARIRGTLIHEPQAFSAVRCATDP